jgi:hypothetical protein
MTIAILGHIKNSLKRAATHLHFFENMPLKVITILMILTFFLWTVTYLEVNTRRNTISVAEGFFPFDYIYTGIEHVAFSKGEITIEAHNSTSQVQVYSVSNDFNWSFSATPLVTTLGSHPIKILIDWNGNEGYFTLWGDIINGWMYNYSPLDDNYSLNGNPIIWPSNTALTLNCTYFIKTEFKIFPENVTINFAISNSTWSGPNITLYAKLKTDFRLVPVNLQGYAPNATESHAIGVFGNSQLVFKNSIEQNPITPLFLIILSTLTTIIVAITVIVKSIFSSLKRLSFRRSRISVEYLNTKKLGDSLKISARSTYIIILIFAFFIALRLVLAFTQGGNLFDSKIMQIWYSIIANKGVSSIYTQPTILPPFLDISLGFPYPPIIAYIVSLFSYVPPQQNIAEFLLKLPPIFADLLLGLAVFLALRSRMGLSVAIPALFLSLLNFVDSSIWGQYDSIVALFMVLAVWLVATDKIEWGWLFASLAILTKQTALVFLPALLLLSIRRKSWSRLAYGLLVFSATTFFVWFPFFANGFSFDFALSTTGLGLWSSGGGLDPVSPVGGGGTSIFAFNIWPLLTTLRGQPLRSGIIGGVKDVNTEIFSLNYMQIGMVLFLIAYLFIALRIWKSSKPIDQMLNFGVLMFAFFMLPTRIHERYLVFALSFLPFVYKKSRIILFSYLILLSTFCVNLEYALYTGVPPNLYTGMIPNPDLSEYNAVWLVIILINIVVFLLLLFKASNVHIRKPHLPKLCRDR